MRSIGPQEFARAWGYIVTNGSSGLTTNNCYGCTITPPGDIGGAGIIVHLDTPSFDTEYTVVAHIQGGGAWHVLILHSTTSYFTLNPYNNANSPAAINPSTTPGIAISFVVYYRN